LKNGAVPALSKSFGKGKPKLHVRNRLPLHSAPAVPSAVPLALPRDTHPQMLASPRLAPPVSSATGCCTEKCFSPHNYTAGSVSTREAA